MFRSLHLAIALAIISFLSAAAGAQPAGSACESEAPKSQPSGSAPFDRDGDGRVSRQEFEAYHRELFAKLDRNGDGLLSVVEMQRLRAAAVLPD